MLTSVFLLAAASLATSNSTTTSSLSSPPSDVRFGLSGGLGYSHGFLGLMLEVSLPSFALDAAIGLPPTTLGIISVMPTSVYGDLALAGLNDPGHDSDVSLPAFSIGGRWLPLRERDGLALSGHLVLGRGHRVDDGLGYYDATTTLGGLSLTAGWRFLLDEKVLIDVGLGPAVVLRHVVRAGDAPGRRDDIGLTLDAEIAIGYML